MATIKDLFKNQQKELYGLSGTVLIESRGLINPPRGAALLTSSPDALADLIGNQIGGALGGNPNRVSDTIFRKPKGIKTKPVTLPAVTQALLRDSVNAGDKYYIKQSPAPGSIFAKIKSGGTSPAGLAAAGAAAAINAFGSKKGINKLKEKLKFKKPDAGKSYGPQWTMEDLGSSKLRNEDYTFSKYEPVYGVDPSPNTGKTRPEELAQIGIKERDITKTYDTANDAINSTVIVYDNNLDNWKKDNNKAGIVSVIIKPYGKDYNILLPGTISGISEDLSNEVNSFKYVGSPFNTYRYSGVERNIKFELKLYYTNETEKIAMITKINSLKELVFPYDQLSTMTYADSKVSQTAFSPNLIYLSIDGYYKNVFGIMDTLSISVEDNTTWALNDFEENSEDKPYPTVVNISFGMKVIENPTIETSGKITRFKYNFDGNNIKTASTIDFEKKKEVVKQLLANKKLFNTI
jgi:hypothetical protein